MTHYDILGVSKSATQEEIRKAYIQLVKRYHPDLYYGDKKYAEKRTQEINNAYDILSDANARRKYDEEIGVNTTQTYSYSGYSGTQSGTRSNAQSYAQTYTRYADSKPNYEEKERAKNIYEEVLKNYRTRYNEYFDSRNNASNSYGNYQNTVRKKKKKEYSYKGYEKINELCDEWNIGSSLKVSMVIGIIFLMAAFIIFSSLNKSFFYSSKPNESYHAIIPETKKEENGNNIYNDTQNKAMYKRMIEENLCKLYDQYKDELELETAYDVLDLITDDVMDEIFYSYYSDTYTYEMFYKHIWSILDSHIKESQRENSNDY